MWNMAGECLYEFAPDSGPMVKQLVPNRWRDGREVDESDSGGEEEAVGVSVRVMVAGRRSAVGVSVCLVDYYYSTMT